MALKWRKSPDFLRRRNQHSLRAEIHGYEPLSDRSFSVIQPDLQLGVIGKSWLKANAGLLDATRQCYAGLTGDSWRQHQPSHSGGETVQEHPIVQPLFLVGMIGELMNTRIPGDGNKCITVQHEFISPVY